MSDRMERRKRLTPEQKWQVFLEAPRKNATDAEVCRRWGITPWQLRAIRERVKEGAKDALTRGPGRPRRDPEIIELEQEVERTSEGPEGTGHREHPAAGKSQWRLIGPIRGNCLSAEVKLAIVRAVHAQGRRGSPSNGPAG